MMHTISQVFTNASSSGWIYFRSDYQPTSGLTTVFRCTRSDKREVIPEYNVWINKVRKTTYIHVLDYIPAAANRTLDNVYQYSYEILLTKSSNDAPLFENASYHHSIPEEAMAEQFITVIVGNSEPDESLSYRLLDSTLPFSIDAETGSLSTNKALDREERESYSIVVLAVDDSTPPLTGTTVVLLEVTDINDKAPEISHIPNVMILEVGTPVGFEFVSFQVSDKDEGDNGEVVLSLIDSSGLFELNVENRTLRTKSALQQRAGVYPVNIRASDKGSPSKTTNASISVRVRDTNQHAPQFSQGSISVNFSETSNAGVEVVALTATDEDVGDILRFIIQSPDFIPFIINQTTGLITNYVAVDREVKDRYSFQVLVMDDGALPTGPRTGSNDVTIHVSDVNDNNPAFPWKSREIHISEDIEKTKEIFNVTATDTDIGLNAVIASYHLYSLNQTSTDEAKFTLTVSSDKVATILTADQYDRETKDRYHLIIEAVDSGIPPLSSNLTLIIVIDDVNDNPPEFINRTGSVTIPSTTRVNTALYTIRAQDADIGDNGMSANFKTLHSWTLLRIIITLTCIRLLDFGLILCKKSDFKFKFLNSFCTLHSCRYFEIEFFKCYS